MMTANIYVVIIVHWRIDSMGYENISDEEVCRLLKQTVPKLEIGEITDSNRETVMVFLRVLLWMIT
jgi:hypothetical protein